MLRGGIEKARGGGTTTLELSERDLETARDMLGCQGVAVFGYRDAPLTCEHLTVR